MHLPSGEILLMRSVLATCFALAARLPPRYYIPAPVVPLVFLHHFLMPLYLGSFFKRADILLLPLDMIGAAYLIQCLITNKEYICILLCFLASFFLAGELLLRVGWLLGVRLSYSYSILLDVHPSEKSKFYQAIFGKFFSMARFRGEEPTANALAEYGIPAKQLRLIFRGRIFILRCVLVSCCFFLALIPGVQWGVLEGDQFCILLVPFIIIHHLLSCIHMEFDYALFDVPLILFEIITLGSNFPTLGSFGADYWSSPLLNCYTVLACIIFAALVLEAGIWVRVILWHKTSHQLNHHHLDSGSFSSEVIPRPHSVVFGPWLWKEHLSGETRIIRGIRGSIAVAITLIILFYSVLDLLFYPFQNTGLDYLKELRSLGVPNNVAVNNLVWNVIVISPSIPVNISSYSYINSQWEDNFPTAVNVTPLWSTDPDLKSPSCVYLRPDVREYLPDHPEVGSSDYWQPGYRIVDTVYCPPFLNDVPPDVSSIPSKYTTPDLLIEVNFTALNISGSSRSDMSSNSVQVMIGFHNETSKVIQTTKSMTLVPGINMLGCITYELRQSFKNSIAPDLGLFESYDTFVISKMLYAIPDPLASASSTFIKQAPDISTFRVFLQHDYSDLKTLQSYRQQDTLSGFAAVGGLWTFLSGIFAAIFGSSLLRILFGVKPISLAGVAHSIEREKIQEACRREYPRILDEIRLPPEERGLLSLLCDQLIDVKIIEREGRRSGDYVAQSGRGGEDVEMDQLESLKP